MANFPIVVTLVFAISIAASISMMMSLSTFSKEMDEDNDLHYYDNYEVLKMDVVKMAKDSDIWAISAIVAQSASLIFYLIVNQMGTFQNNKNISLEKIFNALIVFVMYGTHLPVVGMMLLIVCGMAPNDETKYKQHVNYAGDDGNADLPSLDEDSLVLMQFGMSLSLVVIGAAIAGTHLINHAHVKDDFGGTKGVMQYIAYLVSLMFVAVGAMFHFNIDVNKGEFCDITESQFKTYNTLRDMSAGLFVCILVEVIGSIAWNAWRKWGSTGYDHPDSKPFCSKEWILFYGAHFICLLKYGFMFAVLYSYAMSSTTYPCLIESAHAVDAGIVLAWACWPCTLAWLHMHSQHRSGNLMCTPFETLVLRAINRGGRTAGAIAHRMRANVTDVEFALLQLHSLGSIKRLCNVLHVYVTKTCETDCAAKPVQRRNTRRDRRIRGLLVHPRTSRPKRK